jgi:hypothetical protein
MNIKTSDLNGAALDWAAAKCEDTLPDSTLYAYSTDWAWGGPIIERESIGLIETEVNSGEWEACKWRSADKHIPLIKSGPTPLIAAMRCYVASRLGDEVEVPKEVGDTAHPAVQAARGLYGSDTIEFDAEPQVSEGATGTWVQAWVFVSNDDLEAA